MQNETTIFLLAEDNPNDAYFVEPEFKHAPSHLQLRIVQDGVHAIEYMEGKGEYADRQKYPIPNVILVDLKMPRIDGFDFLHWLRNEAPEKMRLLPVIVMSFSTDEKDVTRSYKLAQIPT